MQDPILVVVNPVVTLTAYALGLLPCNLSKTYILNEISMSGPVNGSALERIEDAVSGVRELMHAALRPLPVQTGDGSYIEQPESTHVFKDLHDMGFDGVQTLIETVKTDVSGKLADDKKYLMEKVIKVNALVNVSPL